MRRSANTLGRFVSATQGGSDVVQIGSDHMRVVGNAQLVGDGQQQGVGLGDGFVLP